MFKRNPKSNAAAIARQDENEIVLALHHQELLESWRKEGETLGDVIARVIDHQAQIQAQMDYAVELVAARGETPNEVNVRAEFLKLLEEPGRLLM